MSPEKNSNLPGKEIVIGDNTYMVRQLPMRKWFELEALLLSVLGPALSEILAEIPKLFRGDDFFEAFLDMDSRVIGSAMYQFSSRANPKDHERLVLLLGEATWVNERPLGSDSVGIYWPKHMSEFAQYIGHAIRVQFGDFFCGLLNAIPMLSDEDRERLRKSRKSLGKNGSSIGSSQTNGAQQP